MINIFSVNPQKNSFFWQLITQFNLLMKQAIEGPNCIDPKNCKGDCCSIKIDVPRVLAEEYIKRGYANEDDFIRSDVFSFQLRFNENTGKCFLFDLKTNGCSIHSSGIKPVQCWIYPTGFSSEPQKDISCKKLSGWKIKDPQKAKKAEEILKKYLFLCNFEAKRELRAIKSRLKVCSPITSNLIEKFKNIKPSELAGVKDKWDSVDILSAEGLSLQVKRLCLVHNPGCPLLPDEYFECKSICETISYKLYNYINASIYEFVKMNGQDPNGEYPLIKLFSFKKRK